MTDAHGELGGMRGLITTNTRIMGELGARALVLGKFLEAALPCLTAVQRDEVRRSFRQGVEDVMSLMDEVTQQNAAWVEEAAPRAGRRAHAATRLRPECFAV